MAKGSQFERDTCRQLSQWWAGRDDVFWRSSNSGGRATIRKKSGKHTIGQFGDVAATDPVGLPLLDLITFELKRGYKSANLHDMLDAPNTSAKPMFLQFIEQAIAAQVNAASFAWAVIHKRDRRDTWIYFPDFLFGEFLRVGALSTYPLSMVTASTAFCKQKKLIIFGGMSLDGFLQHVTPEHVKRLIKEV